MKKCTIIYNPKSGKGLREKQIEQIMDLLLEYGYDADIIYTQYKNHAKEIVASLPHVDLLLSVGGDGTFSEIVTANVKREKPILLALLPQGTTNDVASMYGYGNNLLTNLRNVLNGKIKKVESF